MVTQSVLYCHTKENKGHSDNLEWTKGPFFENAIEHKNQIQFTVHLVATLPITLEL